jgi:hypothetical protein
MWHSYTNVVDLFPVLRRLPLAAVNAWSSRHTVYKEQPAPRGLPSQFSPSRRRPATRTPHPRPHRAPSARSFSGAGSAPRPSPPARGREGARAAPSPRPQLHATRCAQSARSPCHAISYARPHPRRGRRGSAVPFSSVQFKAIGDQGGPGAEGHGAGAPRPRSSLRPPPSRSRSRGRRRSRRGVRTQCRGGGAARLAPLIFPPSAALRELASFLCISRSYACFDARLAYSYFCARIKPGEPVLLGLTSRCM